LASDPALITGQLDNGLHYVIQQHANPPGRAVVWLHMHTGSLNETEHQRGIAHYLEHMAFNGSEHFKPGSLVPFFESLGMTFGRDQNAFTNMEQTTFQLTLPKADADTLGKGMTFFSDVVCRLSLLPSEIDDERQIIQEERRRGLSGRERTSTYVMEHMTPGSIYGHRITIGTEASINGVHEQDFKDYYGKWYSASNATLIVVADADPAAVAKVIKEQFGSAPRKPRPTPQDLTLKPYDKSFAIVTTDPEVRSAEIQIVRIEPARPVVTTAPQYTDDLVMRLGDLAMNRRLGEKVAAGGTSYLSGRVGLRNDPGSIFTAELTGSARPEKWKPALSELAMELQRARAFGFTAKELDHIKKELVSGAERAAQTESTATSAAIMQRLNGAVTSGGPILSAQQRLDLLTKTLASITPEQVSQRFAKEFDPTAVAFVAVLPSSVEAPTEAQLLELGVKALDVKPTQETEDTDRATTLMTELPKPGVVAEQSEHAASKVWSGWLSNNTRAHYRFMDEQKNEVAVHISLAGGELLETAADRGITTAAQLGWSRPATKHLSSADIREIMTGRKIAVRGGGFGGFGGGRGGRGGGGGGAGDSISLTITGSPEELETGFQLAYLLLTEPKIESNAFTQWQTTYRQMLEESSTNPSRLAQRLIAAAPFPESEIRTRPPTVEQIDRITLDAAQARLEKLIRESPIEVAIVGDLPKDRALELVNRYLGSLAGRDRISTQTYAPLRKVERPKGPKLIEKAVQTPTQQAMVFSGFYGADDTNLPDVRALSLASRILSTRMTREIREEKQLVYSMGASSRPATTYPGFGIFSASAPTEPAKAPALMSTVAEMYQAFAKDGPTDDEIVVAKKQFAKDFVDQAKEPGTWLARLEHLTQRGISLDDYLGAPQAYEALTAAQVKGTFAKYYTPESTIVICVQPVQGKGDGSN
jgi:zinc protease